MNLFSGRSIPDEAKKYLIHLEKKGRQPSTIQRYAYDLEDFFLWLNANGHDLWKELSVEDLKAYFNFLQQDKHYSRKTTDRILTVLHRFYAYFHEMGIVSGNPAKAIHLSDDDSDDLVEDDFITDDEAKTLLRSIPSLDGLSENQQKSRAYLGERNLAIVTLFLQYGLTLTELVSLRMVDMHFEKNKINIPSVSSDSRTITLTTEDMKRIYSYYRNIPEAVRPGHYSGDSLFVAFDFGRNTYRWDYSVDAPKRLTEIAVQKMIRQEVRRAGLRKGISARHLRRTCILRMLQDGESAETVQAVTGMKTGLSLKRYLHFCQHE
ncbi:MAG TPA: tyrosine-type recombinase/integrase [Bacillales bacterium]|nr:tyrosine-type recombinase/integrase [Bacillales bacterium]